MPVVVNGLFNRRGKQFARGETVPQEWLDEMRADILATAFKRNTLKTVTEKEAKRLAEDIERRRLAGLRDTLWAKIKKLENDALRLKGELAAIGKRRAGIAADFKAASDLTKAAVKEIEDFDKKFGKLQEPEPKKKPAPKLPDDPQLDRLQTIEDGKSKVEQGLGGELLKKMSKDEMLDHVDRRYAVDFDKKEIPPKLNKKRFREWLIKATAEKIEARAKDEEKPTVSDDD